MLQTEERGPEEGMLFRVGLSGACPEGAAGVEQKVLRRSLVGIARWRLAAPSSECQGPPLGTTPMSHMEEPQAGMQGKGGEVEGFPRSQLWTYHVSLLMSAVLLPCPKLLLLTDVATAIQGVRHIHRPPPCFQLTPRLFSTGAV